LSAKGETYRDLLSAARSLLAGTRDAVANAANLSALLHDLPDLNWDGFYFLKNRELILGPFQGRPACVRIAPGRGACGAAVRSGRTIIVPDVHAFAGHIACDASSNSELVVPLLNDGRTLGVIDLDSPRFARFDEEDAAGIETLGRLWLAASDCNWG
jgi:L-methionine (R)-S-oxide reductase